MKRFLDRLQLKLLLWLSKRMQCITITAQAMGVVANELQAVARFVDSSGQIPKRQKVKMMPHLTAAGNALYAGTDLLGLYERGIERQKQIDAIKVKVPKVHQSAGERYLRALYNLVRRPSRRKRAPSAVPVPPEAAEERAAS